LPSGRFQLMIDLAARTRPSIIVGMGTPNKANWVSI